MREKYPLVINVSIYPLIHWFSKNSNNQFCGNHDSEFVFKSQRTGQRIAHHGSFMKPLEFFGIFGVTGTSHYLIPNVLP
jgi:hypothetical protein